MDISGRAREGWMALIPLTVLIGVIVIVLGGPTAFLRTLTEWSLDLKSFVVGVVKNM